MRKADKLLTKQPNNSTEEEDILKAHRNSRTSHQKHNTTNNSNAYPYLATLANEVDRSRGSGGLVSSIENEMDDDDDAIMRRRSNVIDTASLLSGFSVKKDKPSTATSVTDITSKDKANSNPSKSEIFNSNSEKVKQQALAQKQTTTNNNSDNRDFVQRRTVITASDTSEFQAQLGRRTTVRERPEARPALFEKHSLSPDGRSRSGQDQVVDLLRKSEIPKQKQNAESKTEQNKKQLERTPSPKNQTNSYNNVSDSSPKGEKDPLGVSNINEVVENFPKEEQYEQYEETKENLTSLKASDYEMTFEEYVHQSTEPNIYRLEEAEDETKDEAKDEVKDPNPVEVVEEEEDDDTAFPIQRSDKHINDSIKESALSEHSMGSRQNSTTIPNNDPPEEPEELPDRRTQRIRTTFEKPKPPGNEEDHPLSYKRRVVSPPPGYRSGGFSDKTESQEDARGQTRKERSRVEGFDAKESLLLFSGKVPANKDARSPVRVRSSKLDDNLKVHMKDFKPGSSSQLEKIFKSKRFLEILRKVDTEKFPTREPVTEEPQQQQVEPVEQNAAVNELEDIKDLGISEIADLDLNAQVPDPKIASKFRTAVEKVTKIHPKIEVAEIVDAPSSLRSQSDLDQQFANNKLELQRNSSVASDMKSRSASRDVMQMLSQSGPRKKCKRLLAHRGMPTTNKSSTKDKKQSNKHKSQKQISKPPIPSCFEGTGDQLKDLEDQEQAVMSFVLPEKCERCLLITKHSHKDDYELDFQQSMLLQPLSSFFWFAIGDNVKNTSLGQPRTIEVTTTL